MAVDPDRYPPALQSVESYDPLRRRLAEALEEVTILKQIARAAGAMLSEDDSAEQIRKRDPELRARWIAARAAYYQRFGRSAP